MLACLGVPVSIGRRYLGYNALKDFFPTMEIRPNVACVNPACVKLQAQVQARKSTPEALAAARAKEEEAARLAAEAVVHETNEWGIEVVSVRSLRRGT